jgi:predicted phosphodiesterase
LIELKRFKGTIAAVNDMHYPDVDLRAVNTSNALITLTKPEVIVILGDLHDFYSLSDFDKSPSRLDKLQEELDEASLYLQVLRTNNPDARIIFLEGNHEDRLRRYLWSQAKPLATLRCMDIKSLFSLKDYEVESIPYEEGLLINSTFLFLHGDLVRAHSSYTAHAMMDKHSGNGMIGHTHRGGSFYKVTRSGYQGWWENWCLCDLNPDYTKYPNWQQGMSLVQFAGNHQFFVEQIPIIEGQAIYGGKLI